MPRKTPTTDGETTEAEDGSETPWTDLPRGAPEKTCAHCDGHQLDEHESLMNVRVGTAARCLVEIPILLGDGTTEMHRCPCPGWRSVWVQSIVDRGPENWADDAEHAAFAARHGMEFCADCGQPGTAHFRGNATVPAFDGADVCSGFRTEPDPSEAPAPVSIWPVERYEGQTVLERTISFGGKIVLAVDSQAHIDLWDRLHAGERVTLDVTIEAGATAYSPVRSGGAHKSDSVVIGMSRGRKVRVAEIHVGFLEAAVYGDTGEGADEDDDDDGEHAAHPDGPSPAVRSILEQSLAIASDPGE